MIIVNFDNAKFSNNAICTTISHVSPQQVHSFRFIRTSKTEVQGGCSQFSQNFLGLIVLNLLLNYWGVGNLDNRQYIRHHWMFCKGQLIHENQRGDETKLSILLRLTRK